MKKHFSISSCLELILNVFSSPTLLMSCPQGPFGSWKCDFLIFSRLLFRVSCPQGPFGGWKFDFFNFSSPLSGCRARRGLLGAGNLTFLIVQPIIHPYSPLFALICLYLPLFTLNYPSQGPNSPLYKRVESLMPPGGVGGKTWFLTPREDNGTGEEHDIIHTW